MVFAALRKRPSTRDIRHHHNNDASAISKSAAGRQTLAPFNAAPVPTPTPASAPTSAAPAATSSSEIPRPKSASSHSRLFSPFKDPSQPQERRFSFHRPRTPNSKATPTTQGEPQRFSLIRSRHASDPQLSTTFRSFQPSSSTGSNSPIGAPAPVIGITAPTFYEDTPQPKKQKRSLNPFASRQQSFRSKSYNAVVQKLPTPDAEGAKRAVPGHVSFDESPRPSSSSQTIPPPPPPPYAEGEDLPPRNSLAVPSTASQPSESSVSDRTSGEPYAYATTTTTHTVSTTTTFFKLRRRNRNKDKQVSKRANSLFPLPDKPATAGATARQTEPIRPSFQSVHPSVASRDASPTGLPRASFQSHASNGALSPFPTLAHGSSNPHPTSSTPAPRRLIRQNSDTSVRSGQTHSASTSMFPPPRHTLRDRAGTGASTSSRGLDGHASTLHFLDSARTSSASNTLGRNSMAGLRSLTSRFRPPELGSSRNASPGTAIPGLKSNQSSFAQSQDSPVVPEREEGEGAGKYYSRLEQEIPKRTIAIILSKRVDPFSKDVLRSLMRTFKFYEEPMDVALRKLLWEINLPGEAQQIDRVMSAFAERYHECNPHIFSNFEEAYFIAYSLIILHSDLFNRNNKRKMQRHEYQKNTGGQGVDEEILGYLYDNIHYTEFIAQNVDGDEDPERKLKSTLRKKKALPSKTPVVTGTGPELASKIGKVDPYDIILDEKVKLEVLRPSLKDVMNLEDTYAYLGTAGQWDLRKIQEAFSIPSILQVVSARSRPEAFMSPSTITNPDQAPQGKVDISVVKVGILWRKDIKKKKGRSPWNEWGVLLTASQVYFFRDADWVRKLVSQVEAHHKYGNSKVPLVFKDAIKDFVPELAVRTMSAVALFDQSYSRHKYGFSIVRHEDYFEETLLAQSDADMNDWLAKINYAGAYTASNIPLETVDTRSRPQDKPTLRPVQSATSSDTGVASNGDTAPAMASVKQIGQIGNIPRKELLSKRVENIENQVAITLQKMEEHLKTARHLQILAPFLPRTRTELLSFGARTAHKVRWTRFDVWRLKCHRDILAKELQIHEEADAQPILVDPRPNRIHQSASTSRPSALSRWNSKATGILTGQKGSRHGRESPRLTPRAGATLPHHSDNAAELAGGIDQAFATPLETLEKTDGGEYLVGGPYKLPPLKLGGGTGANADHLDDEILPPLSPGRRSVRSGRADAASTSSAPGRSLSRRRGDDGAATESPRAIVPDGNASTMAAAGMVDGSGEEMVVRRPSLADVVPRSHMATMMLPEGEASLARNAAASASEKLVVADRTSRPKRSLHRTLRDGSASGSSQRHGHGHGHGHSRGRKGKESGSTTGTSHEVGKANVSGSVTTLGEEDSEDEDDGEAYGHGHHGELNGSYSSERDGSGSGTVNGGLVLKRGPGSFTVHGKKASVVTVGSDWHAEGLSAEGLLRHMKRGNLSPTGAPAAGDENGRSAHRASLASSLGALGSAMGDGEAGEYPGAAIGSVTETTGELRDAEEEGRRASYVSVSASGTSVTDDGMEYVESHMADNDERYDDNDGDMRPQPAGSGWHNKHGSIRLVRDEEYETRA